jgi:hypothetical protein
LPNPLDNDIHIPKLDTARLKSGSAAEGGAGSDSAAEGGANRQSTT